MAQGLPVSNLVNVSVSLSQTPAQGQNIDTMLIVGSSNVIDVVQRMRTYTSLNAVAVDFLTTSPEYLAAALWFGQSPQPLSLNIGRWAATATTAQLIGAALPGASQLISAWTVLTSAGFSILINGLPVVVDGLNFASVSNLNGVATVIQTGLDTFASGATVVWNSSNHQFLVTLGGTPGLTSTISLMSDPTAQGAVILSGQPSPADTFTFNGTVVTFVSGAPSGNQVQIGGSTANTLANLNAFLLASTDTQLVKFKYYIDSPNLKVWVQAATAGTSGNALTLAKSGTNLAVSAATLAGGQTSSIATLSGMATTSSGAYTANGVAAETALTAVISLDNLYSNQWYGLSVVAAQLVDADVLSIAQYIEGTVVKHYYGATSNEAAALVPNDQTSLPYQLSTLGYNKTCCQFSDSNPYAVVSYLARILTTNWAGNNTTITEMYKQEPGVVGENLSQTQANALKAINCNVFVDYNNGTIIIQYGTSVSGQYTDTIIGADWFAITIQTNVFNALYTTPTKIPQTDAGMNILNAAIQAACVAAVNNGLLAPGTWQTTGFGAITNGTFLSKGYYIYQPPVASQSPADRARRVSVPFQIAAKLAGAVHEADISVTINQ